MRTCFNWKILAGLAVVGVGLYLVAPNQALGALPLLLLAVCPLSMMLMALFMGKGMAGGQCAQQDQQMPQATGAAPTREEQVAQLTIQLQAVQAQQAALAAQLSTLERAPDTSRPASPAEPVRETEKVALIAAGGSDGRDRTLPASEG